MELTMRLLVCPVFLLTALLLLPTTQGLGGIPSLSASLRGNGRRSLSREEELVNALQFLEEYERNLGDSRIDVAEDDWSPQRAFPFLERDTDEDIVPDDFWEDDEQENNILGGKAEQFKIFVQNLLQGANRNDNGYYNPQRSSFNNQYVLFSPVETDLEDEMALNVEIEKLKVKQKEEKLWEDIIGDMIAEEILEMDAREDMKELIEAEEEEAQLNDVLEEDTIFEEEPWSEVESSEAEESDVVPWSWAEPEWETEDESSLVADLETDSLTSEEEEHEAALLLLEDMLAEQEEKQWQEEEQQQILEMVMAGQDSSVEEDEEDNGLDQDTEEAIENYLRALLQNNQPDEEILYDDDEDEIVLGASSEVNEAEEDEESEVASSELDPWDQLSSVPEDTGEIIQEYGPSEEPETEDNDIDYNILLRELTNGIRDEVEDEMAAALEDRIEAENNMRYLNEDDAYEEEDNNDASNEINELDAANLLAQMFLQQQEKRTAPPTCPIRSLVDDCAFIDDFPDVDIDHRYRETFRRACNRHQLCYTCGALYEIESSLCDEVFDAEMLTQCGIDNECISVADQFLFIATNTHLRMPQPPAQCQAKCLLPYLVKY